MRVPLALLLLGSAGVASASLSSLSLLLVGQTGASSQTKQVPTKAKKEVNIWVAKDVAPATKIRLNVNTRNVPVVHVSAYKIDGEAWLSKAGTERKQPALQGKPVRQWDMTIASKGQKPNPRQTDTFYSRQVNLPPMSPGVYLLYVSGGDAPKWAVVNVTDLAVLVKRSPTKMLVWVTDALKGHVISGAKVNVYSKNGGLEATHRTGRDGAVVVAEKPGSETLVVSHERDMAGVQTGAPDPGGKLLAHFQTDRPIYRPGQTVHFKSILRRTQGQVYRPVTSFEATVELRDPKDNPVDRVKLTSNDMGSVSGSFELPSEGMTGPYTLVLTNGKDTVYQTFTVAEYRKPEFQVAVAPLQKRYLAGEEISFKVNATYFFGAPVPQAAVHYSIRRSPMPFWEPDPNESWFYGGDGNLYASDTYGGDEFVASETVHTDENGEVIIKAPTDKAASDSNYVIDVTVEDSSRRQVTGGGSVPVYAAAMRIGIRPEVRYSTLGSLIPFVISATDLDKRPVSAKVKLDMAIQEWNEKKGEYVERIVVSTTVTVPPTGRLAYNLPAREQGDFTIYATAVDGTGRVAKAQTSISVWGNYEKPRKEKPQPTLGVALDKRVYAPGDTAKAFVSTNTKTRPVLVITEGGDIWGYQVLTAPKAGQVVPIKTDTGMSPNAYVSVAQWVNGQLLSGSEVLPLPDPTRALTVQVTPDRNDYRPGDTATYTVRTVSKSGKPVAAEIALSVVDEAIYALRPDVTADLYKTFWGLRPNKVQSFMTAPEEMSGGAYQRVDTVAPLRQRFEDTAYWNAAVVTGADGTAKVTVEMPGNLTTWRTTARAVTLDTSVGSTTNKVRANRPVMLRLATPRQAVQGDRFTLIGTVDNRSEDAHDLEVSLVAEGVRIEGEAKHRISVPAKSQAKVQWQLDASSLPPSGAATLTGQAVALDVPEAERAASSDALRVRLPIVPAGVRERIVAGGVVMQNASATVDIPQDRIEPASSMRITVSGGIGAVARSSADSVIRSGRWGSTSAANHLVAASVMRLPSTSKEVREALALLSKNQHSDGWGWWERAPSDPVITAQVLWSLGVAKRSGITVYDNLMKAGQAGAIQRFNQTNLWEHRALLAAALLMSGANAGDQVAEVLRRGVNLSPFAKLRLAEAMAVAGVAGARELAADALKGVSQGAAESYLPVGDGIGWSATDTETTAQALAAMQRLKINPDLQVQFARYLVSPTLSGWRSTDEQAMVAYGVSLYLQDHSDATTLGDVTIMVNGSPVKAEPSRVADVAVATVPAALLKDSNKIDISRSGVGEALYTVEATVFRQGEEREQGLRVLRRFEVRNAAGVWTELNRPVRPSEPVRATIIVWGDDIPDAVRVWEPIPAGFEFVDGEASDFNEEEVRDGAVVHYLVNAGTPQVFRYYLRAEAEGVLTVLPATAEYLRRPTARGQTGMMKVIVRG